MKTFIKLVFLCALTVLLAMAATAKEKDPPAKGDNVLVYKADKKFVGGRLEVVNAHGIVISGQTLHKRKLFIDFDNVQAGAYTVRLTKGTKKHELKFNKK